MQVQSATDPPKKLALGERSVMADGTEYNIFLLKEAGQPVEIGLSDRRHALHRRTERYLQGGAESECGEAVPELLLHAGRAADHHRCRRPAFAASAGQGASGPQAARRDQTDEGRRRGRAKSRPKRSRRDIRKFSGSDFRRNTWRQCEIETVPPPTCIKGSAALGLSACLPRRCGRRRRAPVAITPHLIEAARKEGKVILYSSMDLAGRRKARQGVRGAYPGISVQIERSGSERLFQRVDQEFASNIHAADIDQHLRRLAFHPLEEERLAGAVRARKMSRNISRPTIAIPTACSRPRGSGCRRSPTTPIW